ncbi:cell division protein ZapE [Candidatus Symbiobacter mobilis]|nr:cell division protein ZapE [Candidatus Symbiobacter mobilis]
MPGSVHRVYEAELHKKGYAPDAAQLRAVQVLDHCAQEWAVYLHKRSNVLRKWIHRPAVPHGVYLHGGVGRGKSFLMDCFYCAVPVRRKTRLHFHEFMREVHRELFALKGYANPLAVLAKHVASRYRLICFDEFHISDITDAMVLYRLLQALFAQGVGVVATSNYHPDALYPNGLNRERLLPAIAMLKERMTVLDVDAGIDYRARAFAGVRTFLTPLGPETARAMEHTFALLAEVQDEDPVLHIESRKVRALRRAGGVVWFDFATLCGGARSQIDYLELASRFHTVLLSDVPRLTKPMSSQARRLLWLVDVLYDRRVKLILSSAVPIEELCAEGIDMVEFQRTISRLWEMQTPAFLAAERREVDTSLTARA